MTQKEQLRGAGNQQMIKKHYPQAHRKTDTISPSPIRSLTPARTSRKLVPPPYLDSARECLKMKQIPSQKRLDRQQKILSQARSWSSMMKFTSVSLAKKARDSNKTFVSTLDLSTSAKENQPHKPSRSPIQLQAYKKACQESYESQRVLCRGTYQPEPVRRSRGQSLNRSVDTMPEIVYSTKGEVEKVPTRITNSQKSHFRVGHVVDAAPLRTTIKTEKERNRS
jgi:hypothetical protein